MRFRKRPVVVDAADWVDCLHHQDTKDLFRHYLVRKQMSPLDALRETLMAMDFYAGHPIGRVPGTVDRRLARDVASACRVPLRAVFASGPSELRIDGDAYHRRTKNRRRPR